MVAAKRRIVILGGGFGGLHTALQLGSSLNPAEAEIHLVSLTPHFLFTPLLHEVAAGLLSPGEVAKPIKALVGKRITFHQAAVESIEIGNRVVETDAGSLPYDTLVIALGSEVNYYGLPGIEAQSLPLKTLSDALKMRSHLLRIFERANHEPDPVERRRLLTIVLTGGGCSGVELVGELDYLIRHTLQQAYPAILADRDVELAIVEAGPHIVCPSNDALQARVLQGLRRRRVRVMLSTAVIGSEGGSIVVKDLSNGREGRIPSETLIWTAGIKPNRLVRELPLEKDKRGSLIVDETLQVAGHPEVYALGDCAAITWEEERMVPWTAQAAMQQARTVAHNIAGDIHGHPPVAFRYRHMGEVVTLGGAEGVSEFFGFRLKGLPGWLAARVAHLARLPDWSDRVRVAKDWGLDFLGPRDASTTPESSAAPLPTAKR